MPSKIKKLKNIPTIEVNPKGLSNKNNVIVRNHPGCTTEDLMSYIVPTIKKKRDAIIIHCGAIMSNDNIDELCLGIKKFHLSRKGSGIFPRNLIDYMKKVY